MALVAQRGNRRHVQQPRILRTVRRMACHAALGPHRSMLEHERSTHIGVALGADLILVFRGLQVVCQKRAVHIVTVAALQQTLVHFVVNRHAELRLLVGVALVAKLRLRRPQQLRLRVAAMHAMATRAAHSGPGVG